MGKRCITSESPPTFLSVINFIVFYPIRMKYFINLLVLLILRCGGLCLNPLGIEEKKDMILTGSVGIQQKFDSFMQCIRLCGQILACKSINYIERETVCHINNREAGDAGTNLITLSGSLYVNSRDFPKVCIYSPISSRELSFLPLPGI